MIDPYRDPGSGLLRNNLGITDANRLRLVEATVTAEGNGRTQRAFFHQLAHEAGWPIDWSGLDSDTNRDAAIASLRGDTAPLRTMLDNLVTSR